MAMAEAYCPACDLLTMGNFAGAKSCPACGEQMQVSYDEGYQQEPLEDEEP